MGGGIQGQQDGQQDHQQHLDQRVRRSSRHSQQLTPHRLQIFRTHTSTEGLIQRGESGIVPEPSRQFVDQLWEVLPQLLDLGDQFRQQQLANDQTCQQQTRQYDQQGLGAGQTAAVLELMDQHIQGNGHNHGSEQHQQHPAQLPDQQGQNNKGQAQQS